jgi:hypothetical protein
MNLSIPKLVSILNKVEIQYTFKVYIHLTGLYKSVYYSLSIHYLYTHGYTLSVSHYPKAWGASGPL